MHPVDYLGSIASINQVIKLNAIKLCSNGTDILFGDYAEI